MMKKDNEADVTNCDGMVLSNLDENCTVEDIKKILKESLNEADLETIPVHPAGSTRSKLIKDIMDNIGSIARKIDGKSFNGSLLHCRPHVPISPVKQNNAKVDETKKDDNVEKISVPEKTDISKEVTPTSHIPGLTVAQQEKAKKQAERKVRQKQAKENKAVKENEEKNPLVTKGDFLLKPLNPKSEHFEGFTFSDYAESDPEYMDSKEELDEAEEGENDLQKHMKSFFTKSPGNSKPETPSMSTPGPVNKENPNSKRGAKFANLSPIDNEDTKKKKKTEQRKQ